MKIFIKLMILLVILAIAGPYFLKGPNGKPLLAPPKISIPNIDPQKLLGNGQTPGKQQPQNDKAWIAWSKDVPAKQNKVTIVTGKTAQAAQGRAGVYFRWKDSRGHWQLSDRANPDVANILIETRADRNIIASMSTQKIDAILQRTPEKPAAATGAMKKKGEDISTPSIPFPTTVPVAQIPELLKQARAVQGLLNQRAQQMDAMGF